MSILPPAACDESMLSQTNELLKIENEYGRDWQEEALEFTQMFRAKFPAWAQAYEQQAQADTNKPPFTKEAQAEICTLAEEVEKLQTELESDKKSISRKDGRKGGGKPAEHAAKQFDALKKLARIKELLPKDGGNGGGQNQQQNQNNQQNQDQKQDQKQNQDQNQNNQQQQDQDQNNQQEQDQQSEKKEQKEKQSSSEEEDDKKDEQVEDILRRAKERSDQHEADKKARMNKAPLPSNERDW
jgi:hypothetical protein